jgi:plastocyanin
MMRRLPAEVSGPGGGARPRLSRLVALALLMSVASGITSRAAAGTVDAVVRDPAGQPVSEAVISATALPGRLPTRASSARTVIDQQDKEFVPHVKAIQVGTPVMFPNRDNIRHHVYSFSPAKKFELPLYTGTPAAPVEFDQPGVVVLGCNIHDWMLGFVYVLETPYFDTTTTSGVARLKDLPPGAYELRVWHPRMREGGDVLSRRVTIRERTEEQVEFQISLKPEWRPRRAPARAGDRYR